MRQLREFYMKLHRRERISQLVRDIMSELLIRELEFPLGTLVTITEVDVSGDLEHAKVRVSVLPATQEEKVMTVLKKFRGHLQGLLGRKLNIRPMPQILFSADHGLENAALVEKDLMGVDLGANNE